MRITIARIKLLVTLLILSLLIIACARQIYQVTYPTLVDGRYDSEFPYRSSSQQLEEIGKTVRMVSSMAFYKGFALPEAAAVTLADIPGIELKEIATDRIFYNNSSTGTATVIYARNRQVALLTCAHVVDFPDTVYSFYDRANTLIKSIAVKDNQIIYTTDLPEGGQVEILLTDKKLDIALLGKKLTKDPQFVITTFDYPFGMARELEWGSFVYLFGYPIGNKMITKGIVSNPRNDKGNTFLVDAPFNRGSSGSIVLAIRDGIPNFELVGIANSASANIDYVLGPDKDVDPREMNTYLPFTGELYLKQKEEIRYGVTRIIAIEAIEKLLKKNHRRLMEQGYDLSVILE